MCWFPIYGWDLYSVWISLCRAVGGGICLSVGYLIYFIQQVFIVLPLCQDLLGSFAGVTVEGTTDFFCIQIYKYICFFYAFKFIGMLTAVHLMSLSPLGLEVTIRSTKELVKSLWIWSFLVKMEVLPAAVNVLLLCLRVVQVIWSLCDSWAPIVSSDAMLSRSLWLLWILSSKN